MARRWWTDEVYKNELQSKIDLGWYIKIEGSQNFGQVTNVIYVGLKVRLPDGSSFNISPDCPEMRDISIDHYKMHTTLWLQQREFDRHTKIQRIEDERVFQAATRALQQTCQHTTVIVSRVVKVAGCDIDDTTCDICHKILRRSYSTASDRDPDDYISDWQWWLRTYAATWGTREEPQETNYRIVDEISSSDLS